MSIESETSHPIIPFSSCPQSFPASGSFPESQLFTAGGQSTGTSASGSFSFSFSPSNEYSGLISFRTDWFDLLAVQSTLKNLLQHYNSKASILWLSLLYGPTLTSTHAYWKNQFWLTDLYQQGMSLLFNMLPRFVMEKEMTTHSIIFAWKISWTEEPVGLQSMESQRVRYDWASQQQQTRFVMAFLPRSKCILISWLQSPSPVISKPKQIKSVTGSTFFPSTCHEVMGPDAMIFILGMLSVKATFSVSMLRVYK